MSAERQQQIEALEARAAYIAENLGQLFDPAYSEPIDTTGQVTRIPGTADAACMCGEAECRWPFDTTCWPTNEQEDE